MYHLEYCSLPCQSHSVTLITHISHFPGARGAKDVQPRVLQPATRCRAQQDGPRGVNHYHVWNILEDSVA